MLTTKTVADALNGIGYLEEPDKEMREAARAAGIVIVYGCSDDNVELRGAVYDEISAFDGTTFHMTGIGLLANECPDEDCPYFKMAKDSAIPIKAVWHDQGDEEGRAWTYKTDIPHETFDKYDDGEKWCQGIVFALSDVAALIASKAAP